MLIREREQGGRERARRERGSFADSGDSTLEALTVTGCGNPGCVFPVEEITFRR